MDEWGYGQNRKPQNDQATGRGVSVIMGYVREPRRPMRPIHSYEKFESLWDAGGVGKEPATNGESEGWRLAGLLVVPGRQRAGTTSRK